MREDTDLVGIDRLAQQYMGKLYPQRDRRRISAWIAVDGWLGALRTAASQAGPNDCLLSLTSQNRMFCAQRKDHYMRSRTTLNRRYGP